MCSTCYATVEARTGTGACPYGGLTKGRTQQRPAPRLSGLIIECRTNRIHRQIGGVFPRGGQAAERGLDIGTRDFAGLIGRFAPHPFRQHGPGSNGRRASLRLKNRSIDDAIFQREVQGQGGARSGIFRIPYRIRVLQRADISGMFEVIPQNWGISVGHGITRWLGLGDCGGAHGVFGALACACRGARPSSR